MLFEGISTSSSPSSKRYLMDTFRSIYYVYKVNKSQAC